MSDVVLFFLLVADIFQLLISYPDTNVELTHYG